MFETSKARLSCRNGHSGRNRRYIHKLAARRLMVEPLEDRRLLTVMAMLDQKVFDPAGNNADVFGFDVAIDGGVAVVGARYDDPKGTDSGAAHIYRQQIDGSWARETQLIASNGRAWDWFSHDAAIQGNWALLGANGRDENGFESGGVYSFHHEEVTTGTWTWQEEQLLLASDGQSEDWFGNAIDIDGPWAVIAAYGDDDNGTASGSAYFFHFEDTGSGNWQWIQKQKALASDGEAYDYFGYSVSISGDWAVIGARDDDDAALNAGAAYLFHYEETEPSTWRWVEKTKVTASDSVADQAFGAASVIDRDWLVVGAYAAGAGAAYAFRYQEGTPGSWDWIEQAKLTASDGQTGDLFGCSVDLDGDYLVVGAQGADINPTDAGAAYVFQRQGDDSWQEVMKLQSQNPVNNARVGVSVGISENRLVAGAPSDSGRVANTGAAYFHSLGLMLANVSADSPIDEGDPTTVSGNIIAPEEQGELKLTIDWGDGTPVEIFQYAEGTTGFSETHAYVDDGPSPGNGTASDDYTITVQVEDVASSTTTTTIVSVNNIPPVLESMVVDPIDVTTGEAVTVNATFTEAVPMATRVVFREDFEGYAPGDFVAGQGGWTANPSPLSDARVYVGAGTGLPTQVADGFWNTETAKMALVDNIFVPDGLLRNQVYRLTFDAYATADTPPSSNAGVYFRADENLGTGWFMDGRTWVYGQPVWQFDARGITGDAQNLQRFRNVGYDTPVTLTTVLDPINGEVYGLADFGDDEIVETDHYPVTPEQFASVDGVTMHQDYRNWAQYRGAEIDNIVVTETGRSRDALTVEVDWGDGCVETSPAIAVTEEPGDPDTPTGGTLAGSHSYARGGVYTVTTTVRDDDGGQDVETATVWVTGAGLNDGQLQVIGSADRDFIWLNHKRASRKNPELIQVLAALGPFRKQLLLEVPVSEVNSIFMQLGDGNDYVCISNKIKIGATILAGAGNDKILAGGGNDWIDGQDGNDHLVGSDGNDVLLGGDGNDYLLGGRGRDLLIGGISADKLRGGADDDLLIGGYTAHDAQRSALEAIFAEWIAPRDYGDRTDNLRGDGLDPRANDPYFLKAADPDRTVYDDGTVDDLNGERGRDWFFADLDKQDGDDDKVKRERNELVELIAELL